MRELDIDRYLRRIGCERAPGVSAAALTRLQERHLSTVPFENLDIHLGRPLDLDPDALMSKVVDRRRGGFCYELNGLFADLLRALGYDVTLLSCRVYRPDGQLGPEHDHLALQVKCAGEWLVDVGFGDAFASPLDLTDDGPQIRRGRAYRITHKGGLITYAARAPDGDFRDQYSFTLAARTMATFADMCLYHQQSPESPFTRKLVCTRMTESGRITLRNDRLIHTEGEQRRETVIDGESDFREALARHFQMTPERLPALAP